MGTKRSLLLVVPLRGAVSLACHRSARSRNESEYISLFLPVSLPTVIFIKPSAFYPSPRSSPGHFKCETNSKFLLKTPLKNPLCSSANTQQGLGCWFAKCPRQKTLVYVSQQYSFIPCLLQRQDGLNHHLLSSCSLHVPGLLLFHSRARINFPTTTLII